MQQVENMSTSQIIAEANRLNDLVLDMFDEAEIAQTRARIAELDAELDLRS